MITKGLIRFGITSLALVNGLAGLGCIQVKAGEGAASANISMAPSGSGAAQEKAAAAQTHAATEAPTEAPTKVPTAKPTKTPDPTPEPYDPYTLTDEEAIEMGTYIYDNYVVKYKENWDDDLLITSDEYSQQEDLINYVCWFNQKYSFVYPDRSSAMDDGDVIHPNGILSTLLASGFEYSDAVGGQLFPYSLFLKDGRPEKEVLEELESEFSYILNNKVSDDEIYKYFGKVFKLAINADETFKDWNDFNFTLFYYEVRMQALFLILNNEKFNNSDGYIPASYVFGGSRNDKIDIADPFFMRDSVPRNRYPKLTNEEFNAYVGCLEEYLDAWCIRNNDCEYVLQRMKDSN